MSELRDKLIAGIRASREKFENAGDRAEELRTLPHDAVAILRSLGLFWLKTPAELAGTPLSPVEFSDVIEELAYVDTSTAWAAMIGNGRNGLAGGWLPQERARRPRRRPARAGPARLRPQRSAAARPRPGPPRPRRHDRAGHPHGPLPRRSHRQRARRLPQGTRPGRDQDPRGPRDPPRGNGR